MTSLGTPAVTSKVTALCPRRIRFKPSNKLSPCKDNAIYFFPPPIPLCDGHLSRTVTTKCTGSGSALSHQLEPRLYAKHHLSSPQEEASGNEGETA